MVEKQQIVHIEILKSDREEFSNFFKDFGIRQVTNTNTSQQNGCSKQMNRSVVGRAKLDKEFGKSSNFNEGR